MYSLVKKLLRMYENQEIYNNDVIDDMIGKVKAMIRSMNTRMDEMVTNLQRHMHRIALTDMKGPITNTNNIDYNTPTPQIRQL